jgi:hypothetical protein
LCTMTPEMKVDLETLTLGPVEIRQPLGRTGIRQSL